VRDARAHGEAALAGPAGHAVVNTPLDRPLQRGVTAAGIAETEARGQLVEIDYESLRLDVEPVGEPAKEPGRGRY
jgi:hypothetical protein